MIAGRQGPIFSPISVTMAWAMAGELDRCFEWLDRAHAQRDPDLLSIFHMLPDAALEDPRFAELLPRIGFPGAS